jgi:hypothetical protein
MSAPNLILVSGAAPAPAAPAEAEVQKLPPRSLTLYSLEEHLVALGDSVDLVAEGQEQEFLADFKAALMAAIEKRDRVGEFLVHLASQAELAAAEIKRLQERKAAYLRTIERIEGYVIHVIKSLGEDNKGKWRKLEGQHFTFGLKKCPDSVQITDEQEVPAAFKNATLTLPLELWDELLDALDIERAAHIADAIRKPEITVRKQDVKAALQSDAPVPGARLADTKYSLVVK